jgi:hypothetical protein
MCRLKGRSERGPRSGPTLPLMMRLPGTEGGVGHVATDRGQHAKRVGELFDVEGPTSGAGRTLLNRLFLVARLELVSFAIVVALMVFKPG